MCFLHARNTKKYTPQLKNEGISTHTIEFTHIMSAPSHRRNRQTKLAFCRRSKVPFFYIQIFLGNETSFMKDFSTYIMFQIKAKYRLLEYIYPYDSELLVRPKSIFFMLYHLS